MVVVAVLMLGVGGCALHYEQGVMHGSLMCVEFDTVLGGVKCVDGMVPEAHIGAGVD